MESLNVIAQADFAVQIHIAFAMAAIVTTPFVLWRRRRDRMHKALGYFWTLMIAGTALSSFAISNFGVIGPFSPLHGLAILTLYTLFTTIRAAIRRDITRHKTGLRNLATYGLGIPMVLIFLPDRTFTKAFTDGDPTAMRTVMSLTLISIVIWRLSVREDRPLQKLGARLSIVGRTFS